MRKLLALALVFLTALALTTTAAFADDTTITWGPASTLDLPSGAPRAISCPTATFCMVVDEAGQAVAVTNGVPAKPVPAGGVLDSVSCRSATFCLAGGTAGDVYVLHGTTWRFGRDLGGDSDVHVSCATTTFCVAAAGYVTSRYNGSTWAPALRTSYSGAAFTAISCSTSTFCVATASGTSSSGVFNRAYRMVGTRWSSTALTASGNHVAVSVSCVGSTFCLALSGNAVTRYGSTGWRSAGFVNFSGDTTELSCRSTTFCMAVSSGANPGVSASRFNGQTWTQPTGILNTGDTLGAHVSCGSTTSCTTVDYYGDGRRWTGSWQPIQVLDHTQGGGYTGLKVSCGAPTLCVAVDHYGNYLAYHGSSWTAPRRIATSAQGTVDVSCVGATFCLTVDSTGRAWSYSGVSWHAGAVSGLPHDIGASIMLSCGSPTFCVAIGLGGVGAVYNGTAWSTPVRYDRSQGQTWSISCTSAKFCGIVGLNQPAETLYTYSQGVWAKAGLIPDDAWAVSQVSCVGSDFCLLNGTHQITRAGGQFTTLPSVAASPVAASCISAALCVLDEYSNYQVWNGSAFEAPKPLSNDILAVDSSISCVAPTFCAAAGLTGVVVGRQ